MRHSSRFFLPVLVATGILAGLPAFAAMMSQEQIAQQIIGKDLVTKRFGMTMHLRYNPGGSVTMKAALTSGSGSWAFDGDTLCMTITKGPKRGTTCTGFEALEDGSYRNSEGMNLRVQQ